MARLGLKIFYLRTRVRQVSQQQLADDLGVRQATLSNIERGSSQPTVPLVIELCKYFDVTPTYLIDDDHGLVPLPSDRWSVRDSLVTAGMWIEAPKKALLDVGKGKVLCPIVPGEAFYDDEARRQRQRDREAELEALYESRRKQERSLVRVLQGELRAHPQRRRPKSQ